MRKVPVQPERQTQPGTEASWVLEPAIPEASLPWAFSTPGADNNGQEHNLQLCFFATSQPELCSPALLLNKS